MFKSGDLVKFGKRGTVVYQVVDISTDTQVMIQKPEGGRIQTGIEISRLVLAYPIEAAYERELARKVEDAKAPAWDYAQPIGPVAPLDWAIDRGIAQTARALAKAEKPKVRTPKGRQATRYGQVMLAALAKKNGRHVHV